MSKLTKEVLLELKQQFKSVHNVFPNRFIDETDKQSDHKSVDGGGQKSHDQS